MTLSKLQVDGMYDENTPVYYAVRAKIDSAEFIRLLERDKEVTVDASQVQQSFVKAVSSVADVFDSKERAIGYRLQELHDLLRNFGDIFSKYNKLCAELPNWRPYD